MTVIWERYWLIDNDRPVHSVLIMISSLLEKMAIISNDNGHDTASSPLLGMHICVTDACLKAEGDLHLRRCQMRLPVALSGRL